MWCDMTYRTKTYIAGDWTGDSDLIDQLHKWNESEYWGLHFVDAHDYAQARDTSLNCSIKASLRKRLDCSKRFVLVVGPGTSKLRAGSCSYCDDYMAASHDCWRSRSVDLRSYIQYECEYAAHYIDDIIVLYNASSILREDCPELLRKTGKHISAYRWNDDGSFSWCYREIKEAFDRP